jgi:hypothetical protein
MPEGMPAEQVTYEWFGRNYHFTEEQTDCLSIEALDWWPVINMARVKAQETKQSQTARVTANTQESHHRVPFTQGMRTPGSG